MFENKNLTMQAKNWLENHFLAPIMKKLFLLPKEPLNPFYLLNLEKNPMDYQMSKALELPKH